MKSCAIKSCSRQQRVSQLGQTEDVGESEADWKDEVRDWQKVTGERWSTRRTLPPERPVSAESIGSDSSVARVVSDEWGESDESDESNGSSNVSGASEEPITCMWWVWLRQMYSMLSVPWLGRAWWVSGPYLDFALTCQACGHMNVSQSLAG